MKYGKHLHILITPSQHEILRKASLKQKKSIGELVRGLIDKIAAPEKN